MQVKDILKKPSGYKATLEVSLKDFTLEVPIKYKRMTSKDIVEPVVFKDQKGDIVLRKFIGEPKHLEWRKADDLEKSAEGEIIAYQVVNNKEIPVKPFERTEHITIKKIMPHEFKENFLIERTFEVWSEEEAELLKLAEYLYKSDSIGLCAVVVSKGYDTQYLGILEPRFIENKFGFLLFLTKKEIVFEHLAESQAKEKVKKAKPQAIAVLDGII
jgi:hypothetical protein